MKNLTNKIKSLTVVEVAMIVLATIIVSGFILFAVNAALHGIKPTYSI